MSKVVIVAFADAMKAEEGVVALRDLLPEANATIYGTAVVRLEMERGLVVVQPTDQGPIPLGVGAIVKGWVEFFETPAGGTHPSEGSEAPPGESWRDYLRTEVMSDDSLTRSATRRSGSFGQPYAPDRSQK